MAAVIRQAWAGGVPARKMDGLVKAMGCEGISKSQASGPCQALDARVREFLDRPLDGTRARLWLDATYLKVRMGGRVVSVAATAAAGVNLEGRREILGLGVGLPEAGEFWVEFLRPPTAGGLSGVQLVISDSHEGLKAAVAQVLGAAWQRCRVHFTRNLQARVPRDCEGLVPALLRQVFAQPDIESAKAHWRQAADQLRPRLPKAAALMDGAGDDVLARMAFPAAHRAKIHSTNPPGAQQGSEARGRRGGHLPPLGQRQAAGGGGADGRNDEWILGQRYMTLETLAEASGTQTPVPKALGH